MKKIINRPENVVSEFLEGFALAYPQLTYHADAQVVTRSMKCPGKVGIVSGGGAGHEPAHVGYVGFGMLDAAVAGNVFSAPGPDRILRGIEAANYGAGVLLVVKNYSGDIMNFEMAQELATMRDIPVERVIVKDDIAVPDSTYSSGRRGIAGTVFVHKIAGAAAERGYSLSMVKAAAEKAAQNVRSIGMSMSSCTLPAVGRPGFMLGDNEVEIGMGIHGEPGVERTDMKSARELAEILVARLTSDFDFQNSQAALLINGLGATPLMELGILNLEVRKLLEAQGIQIHRTFIGNYMTALEMAGCSVSLLRLDDQLKLLLDDPAHTPALTVHREEAAK